MAHAIITHPIEQWEQYNTAAIETIARNCGTVDADNGCYTAAATFKRDSSDTIAAQPAYNAHLLARIKTITGRDLRPHNLDDELRQRSTVTAAHAYTHSAGECDCWSDDMFSQLRQFTQKALNSAPNSPQPMSSWWATRAMWLGNGTASTQPTTQKLRAIVAPPHIRRTKALVLGHTDLKTLIGCDPPNMQCRYATKNEPGKKRRPLRAADDRSYVVAAFASNNIEKYLSIDGCVMRQTPHDVQNTMLAMQNNRRLNNQIILCIDYSDFNNTHTTRSRWLTNLAFALAYRQLKHQQQAAAAAWLAAAQLQHTISGIMANQGLSSGERDTARDNTLLHSIYSKLVEQATTRWYSEFRPAARTQKCGDDEIAIGMRWSHAMLYFDEHARQGHALQPRKLMCSTAVGEFLQYNMSTTTATTPKQPLAPALNNFVSGSWYKTSNYAHDQYPLQVAEAASSCIRRGAHTPTMHGLVASTCSWLCKGTPWRTALLATNMYGAVVTQPEWSRTQALEPSKLARDMKPQAIREYCALIKKRFDVDNTELQVVSNAAAENLYASYLADTRNTTVYSHQPDVAGPLPKPLLAMPTTKALKHFVASATSPRLDPSIWMSVQLGLPAKLITRIGISRIVRRATNAARAHINVSGISDMRYAILPGQYAMLPGALAAAYRPKSGNTHEALQ